MNAASIWSVFENKILPWVLAGGMLTFGAYNSSQTTRILRELLAEEKAEAAVDKATTARAVEELKATIDRYGAIIPPPIGALSP